MTLWLALNSVAITMLGAVLFLVLRQLGFVLQRSGPVGARATTDGPRIGEGISPHFAPAGVNDGKAKLIVFMSETCAICGLVRKGAEELARVWAREADVFLIYDCAEGGSTSLTPIAPGLWLKKDPSLRHRLSVNLVPFAIVTNATAVVVSKGLVNDVTHLESLLEAEMVKRRTRGLDHTVESGAPLPGTEYSH